MKELKYEELYNYMLENNLDVDDMAGFFNGALDYMDQEEKKREAAEKQKAEAERLHEDKVADMKYLLEEFNWYLETYYPEFQDHKMTSKECEDVARNMVLSVDAIFNKVDNIKNLKKYFNIEL